MELWLKSCLCHGRKWSRGDIPSWYVSPPQRQQPLQLPRVWDHFQILRSHTHIHSTPRRCTPPGVAAAAISLKGHALSGVGALIAVRMRMPLIVNFYANNTNSAKLDWLRDIYIYIHFGRDHVLFWMRSWALTSSP